MVSAIFFLKVLAFCRQHPDKMLCISIPYTCQETTDNFLFFRIFKADFSNHAAEAFQWIL